MLTAAPWHNSIGDIATEEATLIHLARAGVAAAPVSVGGTDAECLVIGGGDIIEHDQGGGHGEPWADLLAHFRQPGRHVLNVVGVEPDIIDLVDWSFATDYRLVTVRDLVAADRLAGYLPNVRARPCPATLLEPLPLDFVTSMPGYGPLRELGSDYVVVHRHPAVAGTPAVRTGATPPPWPSTRRPGASTRGGSGTPAPLDPLAGGHARGGRRCARRRHLQPAPRDLRPVAVGAVRRRRSRRR